MKNQKEKEKWYLISFDAVRGMAKIGCKYAEGGNTIYGVHVSKDEAEELECMTSDDLKWFVRLNGAWKIQ